MPRSSNRRFRFRAAAPAGPEGYRKPPIRAAAPPIVLDDTTATLRLYEPIDSWGGYWGVSAREFVDALDELGDAQDIRLHINSPGGEVYEAVAILNALRNHPARVTAVVDGLAASAASLIAAGADELIMGRNTELMIHDAWGIVIGPAEDMRDMARRLDALSDNIASVYAAKAGGPVDDWRAAMLAETWYSAQEAVTAGLADSVEGVDQAQDAEDDAQAAFDLSVFKYAGRASAPQPAMPRHDRPQPDTGFAARHARNRHRLVASRHRMPV